MNRTSIEWTDYTTNLIRYRDPEGRIVHGCIKVSAGCANCYASAWSARGLTGETNGAFTAKRQATLTPYFDDAEAQRILRTRVSGKRVFVGDMTDVFGEWVPDALLDRMFAVFALRPDLTFQLLTKRPERMRAYLTKGPVKRYWNGLLAEWRELEDMPRDSAIAIAAAVMSVSRDGWVQPVEPTPWPLPNVWLGTSVENQATADDRIPELLATPAAVRFLSCEPLLEGLDLEPWLATGLLHWVICGGES